MQTQAPNEPLAAHAYCENLLREQSRREWFAAMFAPATARRHLHALHAFAHEVNKVSAVVSEAGLGEIRLQWWREVIEGLRQSEAAANPVSQALLRTMAHCRLPPSALLSLIEARRFDLYNDPMPSLDALDVYCGETVSALFRMASIVLCEGTEPGGADACGYAGVAMGIADLLCGLPRHAARGRCYIPKDVLARHGALPEAVAAGVVSDPLLNALTEMREIARSHLAHARNATGALDARARPALVATALVEPLLKRMERRDYDPFGPQIALPQWRMQWAMWRFK